MLSFEFFHRFLLSERAGALVKTISRISIVGIWLGVASLVLVMSVMNGFNRSIHSRLLEVEPHLVIGFDQVQQIQQIQDHPVYKKLENMDVDLVAPILHQDVIIRTSDGFVQGAVAYGVTRKRLLHLLKYAEKKSGVEDENLAEKVEQLAAGEIILGEGLADKTGLFRDDSVVVIPPETLLLPTDEAPKYSQGLVKGFVRTEVDRIDGQALYYIVDESFPSLRNTAGVTWSLEIWLNEAERAEALKAQLLAPGLKVETWRERNQALFFALKMEKFIVSFLVGLSTLIAGLSIISVMVLLLTQKKRDIGNLLAMGMTKQEVQKIFISVGMFLSLLGVVGGAITGVVLALSVDRFSENVLPAFYEETNIPAELQMGQLSLIFLVAIFFSYLALWITIKKFALSRPSEILRG